MIATFLCRYGLTFTNYKLTFSNDDDTSSLSSGFTNTGLVSGPLSKTADMCRLMPLNLARLILIRSLHVFR